MLYNHDQAQAGKLRTKSGQMFFHMCDLKIFYRHFVTMHDQKVVKIDLYTYLSAVH